MQISGTYAFRPARTDVLREMQEPDVLRAVIGDAAQVTDQGPGMVRFLFSRKLGMMTVKVPGEIAVVPAGGFAALNLTVAASQRIAGKFEVALRLNLTDRADGGTDMAYDGTINATGLLQAALAARADAVGAKLPLVFDRFAAAINGRLRAA